MTLRRIRDQGSLRLAAVIALVAAIVTIGLFTSGPLSSAQSDVLPELPTSQAAFIKFDGIDGESVDKDHKNWSDILVFNQSAVQPASGAAGTTRRRGDVVLEDIVVVKELDKASPKIQEAVVKGKVFPKVEIHVTASYTDAGRVTYYAYELKNVQVTSYNVGTTGQDSITPSGLPRIAGASLVPLDEFSLSFEEIKVTYSEFDNTGKPQGNVEFTWTVDEGAR